MLMIIRSNVISCTLVIAWLSVTRRLTKDLFIPRRTENNLCYFSVRSEYKLPFTVVMASVSIINYSPRPGVISNSRFSFPDLHKSGDWSFHSVPSSFFSVSTTICFFNPLVCECDDVALSFRPEIKDTRTEYYPCAIIVK